MKQLAKTQEQSCKLLVTTLFTAFMSTSLLACNGDATKNNGNSINSNINASKSEAKSNISSLKHGVIGTFYNTPQFSETVSVTLQNSGVLRTIDNEAFPARPVSARWKGILKIDELGSYGIEMINNKGKVTVSMNGKRIFDNTSSVLIRQATEINNPGLYEVIIDYVDDEGRPLGARDLSLILLTPSKGVPLTADSFFINPKVYNDPKVGALPTIIPAISKLNRSIISDDDIDGDGIPNDLEKNGYTVIKDIYNAKHLVAWSDSMHKDKGYTKFFSSPVLWSTTRDPYSDFAKVTGMIDGTVTVNDPLVAAYPVVLVDTEAITVNNKYQLSNGSSVESSITLSRSSSTSSSFGAEGGLSFSPKGGGLNLGFNFSHSTTFENSNSSTSGQSWSSSIGLDTSDAATVQVNTKYYNIGAASAYDVTPKLSMEVGNSGIATSTAVGGQIAGALAPGKQFPEGNAHIIYSTNDLFGTKPIGLSKVQLDLLQKGTPFSTTAVEVASVIKQLDEHGVIINNPNLETQWPQQLNIIKSGTATLVFRLPGEVKERAVYAVKAEDTKVEANLVMTLKDALNKAFGLKFNSDNTISYINDKGTELILKQNELNIIPISDELNFTVPANIYETRLLPKMKFVIAPKDKILLNGVEYYYDEDGNYYNGFKTLGGAEYFFKNGVKQLGFIKNTNLIGDAVDTHTYYIDATKGKLTGLQSIDNHKYYFDDNGRMITGLTKVGNDSYYFNEENGRAESGLRVINPGVKLTPDMLSSSSKKHSNDSYKNAYNHYLGRTEMYFGADYRAIHSKYLENFGGAPKYFDKNGIYAELVNVRVSNYGGYVSWISTGVGQNILVDDLGQKNSIYQPEDDDIDYFLPLGGWLDHQAQAGADNAFALCEFPSTGEGSIGQNQKQLKLYSYGATHSVTFGGDFKDYSIYYGGVRKYKSKEKLCPEEK